MLLVTPTYLPTYLPSYVPTYLPSYVPTYLPTISVEHSNRHRWVVNKSNVLADIYPHILHTKGKDERQLIPNLPNLWSTFSF